MVTPRLATCWTSYCRSRRTPILALDLQLLAPWAQDRAQDQALDQDQDQDRGQAVVHQLVELLVVEQVSGETPRLDECFGENVNSVELVVMLLICDFIGF